MNEKEVKFLAAKEQKFYFTPHQERKESIVSGRQKFK